MELENRPSAQLFLGAAAGIAGTAAMTLLMKPVIGRVLSERWRPADFVPREIVRWLETTLAREQVLSDDQEWYAAMVAHLGYGATMGALYGLVKGPAGERHFVLNGASWGLLVWMFGYEGWMPAAGVRPATTTFPPTRWVIPVANHVVFGVVTASLLELVRRRNLTGTANAGSDARRGAPAR